MLRWGSCIAFHHKNHLSLGVTLMVSVIHFCAYIGGNAIAEMSYTPGERNPMQFVMSNVECQGGEEDLTDCDFKDGSNCKLQEEVAAVLCSQSKILAVTKVKKENRVKSFTTWIYIYLSTGRIISSHIGS